MTSYENHIAVKKGTSAEIDQVKKLITAQIKAGYTSFAIDASHLFNFAGKTVAEELTPNTEVTIELVNYIKQEYGSDKFGLEVEVGEIGRKDEQGLVLTTPEEAVTFVQELAKASVYPHALAISNGAVHGNVYDQLGGVTSQGSVDMKRTEEIGQALEKEGLATRIVQHGTTGVPMSFIKKEFPHQYIIKANVSTFWMNLVWDVLKQKKPELYQEIWDWTINKFKAENPNQSKGELFGKNSKYAICEFKNKLDNLDEEIKRVIEERAYNGAQEFIDAFRAKGSAEIVRESL